MFAVSMMDPTLQFVFFLVAVILFVIAAFAAVVKPNLIALGLACFAVPFCWNALAAS